MRNRPISHPFSHIDLTPLAGVFLALSCLVLVTYSPREYSKGLVSTEETPQQCHACFNAPSSAAIIVCLTVDGRTSFAASDADLQTAALKQISKQFGVCFPIAYVGRLKTLPFLAVKLEQLPSILATPDFSNVALGHLNSHAKLTDEQLVGCVQAASILAPAYTQLSASLFLLIDARTDASKVMHLLHLFQNQGITHFNLIVNCL